MIAGDPAYNVARLTRAIFPLGISPFSCFSAAIATAAWPPLRSFQLSIDIRNVLPSSYSTMKSTLSKTSSAFTRAPYVVVASISDAATMLRSISRARGRGRYRVSLRVTDVLKDSLREQLPNFAAATETSRALADFEIVGHPYQFG